MCLIQDRIIAPDPSGLCQLYPLAPSNTEKLGSCEKLKYDVAYKR